MAEPTIGELFKLKPVKPYTNSKVLPQQNPSPSLLYGIELEIENASFDWDNSFFTAKEDGSLRNRGVEFVSTPTTYSVLRHKLAEFFTHHALETVYHRDGEPADTSNYSDRTSVHVHTNCQNLTLSELSTICMLYEVFERPLFNYIGHDRDKNIFCVPWSETTITHQIISKFKNGDTSALKGWQKYTALNLHRLVDLGTIEWRHMHGTNDLEFIMGWLRLIGHFYRVAQTIPFEDVSKRIISLNSTSEYRQVADWLFQDDVKLLQSPTFDLDVEDGVLSMKYSYMQQEKKKPSIWDAAPGPELWQAALDANRPVRFTMNNAVIQGQNANAVAIDDVPDDFPRPAAQDPNLWGFAVAREEFDREQEARAVAELEREEAHQRIRQALERINQRQREGV